MKLSRLYTESIARHPQDIQAELLSEDPHFSKLTNETKHFDIFTGGDLADLGFEHLGLNQNERAMLRGALYHTGVRIPRIQMKLRVSEFKMYLITEQSDGAELATLPPDWRKGVIVIDNADRYLWLGKAIKEFQGLSLDPTKYEEHEDGWWLKPN